MKWELDLWYEMWDRAGNQGLETWYDMKGRLKGEEESGSVRGSNLDDLDGTADGGHEGE